MFNLKTMIATAAIAVAAAGNFATPALASQCAKPGMNALANAEPLDQEEMPDREARRPGLTKDGALVSDLLKLLLKIRAKETGVAARLIARSDEIEALAAGVRKNLKILSGWRFEQFGSDALDLVEGRMAFAIENGKLKMSRIAAEERVDA